MADVSRFEHLNLARDAEREADRHFAHSSYD
jgi:hypothetical protein